MSITTMIRWSAVALVLLLTPGTTGAQSGSAPVDLSGQWSLDIHLTDHPEQIARAIQIDTGTFRVELEIPGRGDEAGLAGGDRPLGVGRRGDRDRDRPDDPLSTEERKLLAELTRPVQFPPTRLTIAQSETTVTVTAGDGAPEIMRTDGKAEKRTVEAGTVMRTAAWTGPQLRVGHKVGRAGTLTYTYSIVPTTRQLLIRVNFERVTGQPGPFDIKLVYNRPTT
jgi:hypothetical protein